MTLAGARAATVRRAIDRRDPLPGTSGFAGAVDGRLVRDVLGRYPLFYERTDPHVWAHDPGTLTEPQSLAAGHLRDETGTQRVWSLPEPEPVSDHQHALTELREAIATTLVDTSETGLAVAFSGGVDSALLAARLDAPLYAVGFPDSHDLQAARSGAELLDAELTEIELDHDTIREAVPAVVEATGRTNAMDVQIALPLYVVARRAATDGFDRLALGQGADELFGGYAKIAKAPDDPRVRADTVRGARRELVRGLPEQLERDVLTLRSAGVEPVTPLLADRVVSAALALPEELLVTDGQRKRALRVVGRQWLPDEIRCRDKKALQYGSLTARELDRLARQAGFKRRMDDHVRKFIESLT
jgi:asparagine synthase (glutamine-hydrolysing)